MTDRARKRFFQLRERIVGSVKEIRIIDETVSLIKLTKKQYFHYARDRFVQQDSFYAFAVIFLRACQSHVRTKAGSLARGRTLPYSFYLFFHRKVILSSYPPVNIPLPIVLREFFFFFHLKLNQLIVCWTHETRTEDWNRRRSSLVSSFCFLTTGPRTIVLRGIANGRNIQLVKTRGDESKITFCPGAVKGQEAVAFRRGPHLLPLERNEHSAASVGNVSPIYPVLDNKRRDRGRTIQRTFVRLWDE